MEFIISGKNINVTPAIKDYAYKKLLHVRKYFDHIINVELVISVNKYEHFAEVTLSAKGIKIHAEEKSKDMYQTIDKLEKKLDRQIQKYKEKLTDKKHHNQNFMKSVYIKNQPLKNKVVIQEKLDLKPMSIDEAVLQLQTTNSNFLLFKNNNQDKIQLLYNRNDGNYGLLEY